MTPTMTPVAIPPELLAQALALPNRTRAELMGRLAASLEPAENMVADSDPPTVQEAWRSELERRIESYLRGEVKALDAKESIRLMRERFRAEFGYDQ